MVYTRRPVGVYSRGIPSPVNTSSSPNAGIRASYRNQILILLFLTSIYTTFYYQRGSG